MLKSNNIVNSCWNYDENMLKGWRKTDEMKLEAINIIIMKSRWIVMKSKWNKKLVK